MTERAYCMLKLTASDICNLDSVVWCMFIMRPGLALQLCICDFKNNCKLPRSRSLVTFKVVALTGLCTTIHLAI